MAFIDKLLALLALAVVTIIGGLLLSQLLTLYTTPVIYLLIDRLRRRREPSGVHAPAE